MSAAYLRDDCDFRLTPPAWSVTFFDDTSKETIKLDGKGNVTIKEGVELTDASKLFWKSITEVFQQEYVLADRTPLRRLLEVLKRNSANPHFHSQMACNYPWGSDQFQKDLDSLLEKCNEK
jgi:hypothetical protein